MADKCKACGACRNPETCACCGACRNCGATHRPAAAPTIAPVWPWHPVYPSPLPRLPDPLDPYRPGIVGRPLITWTAPDTSTPPPMHQWRTTTCHDGGVTAWLTDGEVVCNGALS